MVVVEPILALITLNHECFNQLRIMSFLAVAIGIEVVLIINILLILIIQFIIEQLARERHAAVATVTAEI